MFPSVKPDNTKAWAALKDHYEKARSFQLKDLFQEDKERFDKFSIRHGDLLVDYSKNLITAETLQLLLNLADECRVKTPAPA